MGYDGSHITPPEIETCRVSKNVVVMWAAYRRCIRSQEYCVIIRECEDVHLSSAI